ncbi:MAG TPA: hypothetical protein VF548_14460 [Allosphingosinicella sp.]|jgi:hypothetical protein
MTTPIRASAEETALPPGLAGEASALLEPGEALLWVGRGRSGATFSALWPGAAIMVVLLAALLWLMLSVDGWTYRGIPQDGQPPIPANVAARLTLGLFVAAASWSLLQFVRRVAGAPRALAVLTTRRFVLRAGRRPIAVPLAAVERAVANGPRHRAALHFKILKSAGASAGLYPTLFGVGNADSAVEVLQRLGIPARDERWEEVEEAPRSLEAGETVLWSARRGVRAVGAERLMMAAFCVPAPFPLFIALWFIWSGADDTDSPGLTLFACLFATMIAAAILGPMAWFPLSRALPFFGTWVVDAFGTLAVTDRRILFLAPLSGAIDREVAAERLDTVAVVASDESGRGHISLTLKPESGEKYEYMDLFSVPDPDNAVAAINRLIQPK